jgi:hypothetical protein
VFANEVNNIETIQRVLLMTPENIHVNSFMYEPILDMSDEHLSLAEAWRPLCVWAAPECRKIPGAALTFVDDRRH